MARLKAVWPRCRLSWLVNIEWSPLLVGNPDIDEIVPFPRQSFRGTAGPAKFLRWCRTAINGRKPELALDFQGLLRTAFIGRMSRPGLFYGMTDAREGARWLYDRRVRVPVGAAHAVERYLMLVDTVLGEQTAAGSYAAKSPLRFALPEGEAPGLATGRLMERFILLHPFARGAGKSLSGAQVETFCRQLAPRQVVLVGRRGEARYNLPGNALDLLEDTDLAQLIWVMRRATCVVSVDSGPGHLAAALGKPLIVIHTWSDPRRVGPYRDDAWVWKNRRLLPTEQMRLQEEIFFQQGTTPMTTADMEKICALAISLSDSCA